jgi:hypothetical protein
MKMAAEIITPRSEDGVDGQDEKRSKNEKTEYAG